jgi:UV DNA damage repair endonuclease
VCGGFTGLARNGKWSTWSPGRFPIPREEEKFLLALVKAMGKTWGRPEIEGSCQLVCHPDKEERKRRHKLLTRSGVVVQHPDGSLEAVSPEAAEKHLAEMTPEQRACYEEVPPVPGAVS